MTYRRAIALDVLVDEVNAAAPDRDKASDGWIGDPAHQSRTSDHNAWVKDRHGVGVVRAQDIDHDPKNGCDAALIAARVAKMLGKHPALGAGAYVIFNRRIISTDRIREGWRPYSGVNAHTLHVHISVGLRGYDSTKKWGVLGRVVEVARKTVTLTISVKRLRAQAGAVKPRKSGDVRRLQKALNQVASASLTTDGVWGPATARAYRAWQKQLGLTPHGVPSLKSLTVLVARHGRYRIVK